MREFKNLLIRLLLCCVCAVLWFSFPAVAQERGNLAGLIVVFDEGDVFTECVAFEGELTGYELLERAGLSVVIKDYGGGLGFAICKIEDVGRDYPAESCFRTTDDISWRYWYREDGEWIYSGSGVGKRAIGDGDMDAWVWGQGEKEPPDLDFAALCALPEISSEKSTRILGEVAEREFSSIYTPTPDRVAMRIATSVAQNRATPAPVAEKEEQKRDYGVFALLVAVLMVFIGYATLLRKQSARGQDT